MQPDLASVVVGMNDLLRHDYDADATVRDVEETFAALPATGCRVVTMTFPDIGRMLPVMAWLRPREVELNRRLVEVAERHDVAVLDLFPLAMCGDPALWSHDRIHGSREGHRADRRRHGRGARAAGQRRHLERVVAVAAPGCSTPYDGTRGGRRRFVVPFLTRMLLGRGPGTGRTAKRPTCCRSAARRRSRRLPRTSSTAGRWLRSEPSEAGLVEIHQRQVGRLGDRPLGGQVRKVGRAKNCAAATLPS